ncbi:MAG TPA: CarD family transcriptional regulator, partial [Candidatus Angelobacter sp.]|nr:CarD family transcriptional regulator [Candidatus Angelobacter sp.]
MLLNPVKKFIMFSVWSSPANVPSRCFMNGQLNFAIGDKVVYPNHGVGVIEQISSRTIGPNVHKFYLLKIKASSL